MNTNNSSASNNNNISNNNFNTLNSHNSFTNINNNPHMQSNVYKSQLYSNTAQNTNFNSNYSNNINNYQLNSFNNPSHNYINYNNYNNNINNNSTNTHSVIRLNILLEKSKWFNVYNKTKKIAKQQTEITNIESQESDDTLYYTGNAPSKRWGHSANIIYDNQMVVFGGRHNTRAFSTMFMFDLKSLVWSKVNYNNSSNVPQARDSHSSVIYKNEMIIFGGNWQDLIMNDLWRFNFNNKT